MKLFLPHRLHRARWPFCCILAFFLLFLIIEFHSQATAQKKMPEWRAEAGTTERASFFVENRCVQPHRFRVKINVKYLHFDEPADSVLVAGGSTRTLPVLIDATGLKSQVYRSKFETECLDCKQEKNCTLRRTDVMVELNVIESRAKSELAAKYQARLKAELVRLHASVAPNAQPLLDEIVKHGASVFVDTGDDTRKEESFNNLEKFAETLVKYGEKIPKPPLGNSFVTRSRQNEPVLITKKSVQKARAGVCPLFPFCK